MSLCWRQNKRNRIWLSEKLHPQTIDVCKTRLDAFGIDTTVGPITNADFSQRDIAGILVQYPDTNGDVNDFSEITGTAKRHGTLTVVATELLALSLLRPPSEFGADIGKLD